MKGTVQATQVQIRKTEKSISSLEEDFYEECQEVQTIVVNTDNIAKNIGLWNLKERE